MTDCRVCLICLQTDDANTRMTAVFWAAAIGPLVKYADECKVEIERTLCITTFMMCNVEPSSPFQLDGKDEEGVAEYCGHNEVGQKKSSEPAQRPISVCEPADGSTQLVCGPAPW